MTILEGPASARPLVMLVEDDAELLNSRRELFEEEGCTVLPTTSADDAIRELTARHLISMVVTDIELRRRRPGGDQSGIALARYIRNTGRDVVLAGYSANVKEADLPPDTDAIFDRYVTKGELNRRRIRGVARELSAEAADHLTRVIASTGDAIDREFKRTGVDADSIQKYRELISSNRQELEQFWRFEGSQLLTVAASEAHGLEHDIYCWYRQLPANVELEVVGFPVLYAMADSVETATASLLALMRGFAEDLGDGDAVGPAANLATFLGSVFATEPFAPQPSE